MDVALVDPFVDTPVMRGVGLDNSTTDIEHHNHIGISKQSKIVSGNTPAIGASLLSADVSYKMEITDEFPPVGQHKHENPKLQLSSIEAGDAILSHTEEMITNISVNDDCSFAVGADAVTANNESSANLQPVHSAYFDTNDPLLHWLNEALKEQPCLQGDEKNETLHSPGQLVGPWVALNRFPKVSTSSDDFDHFTRIDLDGLSFDAEQNLETVSTVAEDDDIDINEIINYGDGDEMNSQSSSSSVSAVAPVKRSHSCLFAEINDVVDMMMASVENLTSVSASKVAVVDDVGIVTVDEMQEVSNKVEAVPPSNIDTSAVDQLSSEKLDVPASSSHFNSPPISDGLENLNAGNLHSSQLPEDVSQPLQNEQQSSVDKSAVIPPSPHVHCCSWCRGMDAPKTCVSIGVRKHELRIGLSLFNRNAELGIEYLFEKSLLVQHPRNVAKFLMTRKGLSKKAVGEYLGNLRCPFNALVLRHYADAVDLTGLTIDMALQKFQSYFHLPGESQKIERIMEVFSKRYSTCNPDVVSGFLGGSETVFLLSFSVVLLNTDLHNRSIRPDRRMTVNDFIHNLRGIDKGLNIDKNILTGIYQRVKAVELQPSPDHMTKIMEVDGIIIGANKPVLVQPHRRLISFCRLFEVANPGRTQRAGCHQRGVFLFNDLIVVTKPKRKNQGTKFVFRAAFPLSGMAVYVFDTAFYKFGIRLCAADHKVNYLTACAFNDFDWTKFIHDLHDAVLECRDTESAKAEYELKLSASQNCGGCKVTGHGTQLHSARRLSIPLPAGAIHINNELITTTTTYPSGSCRSLDSGLVSSSGTGSASSDQDVSQHLKLIKP